jgi:hypothetical protein
MERRVTTLQIALGVVALFVVAGALASAGDRGGVGGVAGGGGSGVRASGGGGAAGAESVARRVGPIARRVEQVRGLRFESFPKPLIVTPAETRRAQLADLDRSSSPAARRSGERVLELLGLVKPGTDLREVAGKVSSSEVAGYYDTRRKRLAIVSGPAAGDRVLSEITLAHELDHALEDQRIGLREMSAAGADDAVSAYTALVEGSATSVMDDYTRRFVDPGAALGSGLSALGASGSSGSGGSSSGDSIPPYLMSSLLFSYVVGERFVKRLREVGLGWKLVDYALRRRPPRSTEQVIHPDKYLVDERAVRVRLPGVRSRLPRPASAWRRRASGTIGEFDTDQLLKLGVGDIPAGDAAAGWGGGRYELWSRAARSCAQPCRGSSVLVVSWAWDTAADAAEFDRAVRSYVERGLRGRPLPGGGGRWRVGDGAAAVSARGLRTTLAFAPSSAVARRLASGALVR